MCIVAKESLIFMRCHVGCTLGELRNILKAKKKGGDGTHNASYLNQSKNVFTSKIH